MFYDKFAYLCTIKGVTPTRAAIDAGISKSLVTKWKTNGIQVPSPDVLKKLSIYFMVPVSELLDESEKKAPTANGERDILSEIDIAFYGEYKELSEDDQKTIRDMVRIMRQRRSSNETG